MDRVVNEVIGGRDPRNVRWLSLGNSKDNFGVEERLTDVEGIEVCENLVSLDLSGHALSNADRLRKMRQLQELDLSRNRLRRLEGIGRLQNIRVLDVSGNLLEHIPEQMGLLVHLQWLDLRSNKLGVPEEFANLAPCSRLFRIFVKGNPFCGLPTVGDLILKHCSSLVWLDESEVVRNGRAGRALPAHATASEQQIRLDQEFKEKMVRMERQVAAERASVQTLQAQNHDLKSELEATAQLLARKTSEWAIAEEQASRLQQELAFLKIDGPSSYHKAQPNQHNHLNQKRPGKLQIPEEDTELARSQGTASPARRYDDEVSLLSITEASLAGTQAEMSSSVASMGKPQHAAADPVAELWGLISRSPLSGPILPPGDLADALREVEVEIAENAKEATLRLRALNVEFADAKADLSDVQNELEEFQQNMDRRQQNRAMLKHERSAKHRVLPQGLGDAALELEAKQSELRQIASVRKHIQIVVTALRKKLESTQDLLVLYTERLMMDKDAFDEAGNAAIVRRLASLDERIAELRNDLRGAAMHVVMSWSELMDNFSGCAKEVQSTFRTLGYLESLEEVDEDGQPKVFEPTSGFEGGSSSFFDSNVSSLSEQVMRIKEQEGVLRENMQTSEIRMQQVRRSIDSLASSTAVPHSAHSSNSSNSKRSDHLMSPETPATPPSSTRSESLSDYGNTSSQPWKRSIGANGSQHHKVQQEEDDEDEGKQEARREGILQAEARTAHERVRELQAEILQLKCDAWRIEANLRTKQCSIMCAALDEKEAVVQACSKTIRRLRTEAESAATESKIAINQNAKASRIADESSVYSPASRGRPAGEDATFSPTSSSMNHSYNNDAPRGEPTNGKQNHSSSRSRPRKTTDEIADDSTVASAALMAVSEQKAREYRKKVLDNLLESEAKYLEDLQQLVNSFLVPMRRRCLLPPRDLQAICLNAEDLFRLHEALGNALARCHDASEILSAFLKRFERFESYINFGVNCSLSMAIVQVRQGEVAGFANFLRATPNGEDGGTLLKSLLLRPLEQLCVYEQAFHRLSDLNRAGGNAAMQQRLEMLSSMVTDLLNRIDCNVEDAKRRAEALTHITAMIPAHAAMDKRLVTWLTNPSLRVRRRTFQLEEKCAELLLMIPNRKALCIRRCVCLAFSDCVVLASAGPTSSKWQPTFTEERPRRKAIWIFRGMDGLTCSRPFHIAPQSPGSRSPMSRSSLSSPFGGSEEKRSLGVRICANLPGGKPSPADDIPVVEAVVTLIADGAADRVYNAVDTILSNFQTDYERAGDKASVVGDKKYAEEKVRMQLPEVLDIRNSSGTIEHDVASMADVDPSDAKLSYIPKYPGTDMKKRREMARKRQEMRNQWKPPELENVNAVVALERIRKRDGMPLADDHRPPEFVQPLFRSYPRAAGNDAPISLPSAGAGSVFMTPIKADMAAKSSFSSQRVKKSVGFGSTAKLERNEPVAIRKSAIKTARSPCSGSRPTLNLDDLPEVNFDTTSPYYNKNKPRSTKGRPDLSIFKAPQRVQDDLNGPDHGYRSRRLIGLPADVSNVVKEFHTAEQKYYKAP